MAKKKTLAELKAEKKEADEKYYAELKETMSHGNPPIFNGAQP